VSFYYRNSGIADNLAAETAPTGLLCVGAALAARIGMKTDKMDKPLGASTMIRAPGCLMAEAFSPGVVALRVLT